MVLHCCTAGHCVAQVIELVSVHCATETCHCTECLFIACIYIPQNMSSV